MFGEDVSTLTAVKKGRVKSNTPRKMAMYIARKYGNYRYQDLADAFGLQHYGGASYAVFAFTPALKKAQRLQVSVNNVVKNLGVAIQVDQWT